MALVHTHWSWASGIQFDFASHIKFLKTIAPKEGLFILPNAHKVSSFFGNISTVLYKHYLVIWEEAKIKIVQSKWRRKGVLNVFHWWRAVRACMSLQPQIKGSKYQNDIVQIKVHNPPKDKCNDESRVVPNKRPYYSQKTISCDISFSCFYENVKKTHII